MTRQVVIEVFGKPDETQTSVNHEYLIYRKRGYFIGCKDGMVDTYGDLKNGRVESVPDPNPGTENAAELEPGGNIGCK